MASVSKILPQSRVLPLRKFVARSRAVEWSEQLVLAIDTLRQNPLRSALTIPRNRDRDHDGDYRQFRDQRTERQCSWRNSRAGIGHHHLLPVSVGLAVASAERVVHAQGTGTGMGRRYGPLASCAGGDAFVEDFPATVWFRNIGRSPWHVPSEECDPARRRVFRRFLI